MIDGSDNFGLQLFVIFGFGCCLCCWFFTLIVIVLDVIVGVIYVNFVYVVNESSKLLMFVDVVHDVVLKVVL